MTISERLFDMMKQQNISISELSRMTGISRHTIFDWQRRGTNPGADKIMIICEALHVTPEQLLTGKCGKAENRDPSSNKGEKMKLKNVLIVVKDIERSRQFYHDLFGLERILDNDGNMILTEGLVLQEEKYWKEFLGREIIPENNASELYFEESDIEGFIERLEKYYPDVKYINRLMTHSWGQKVIRFYDPDGNLIEVGTPM